MATDGATLVQSDDDQLVQRFVQERFLELFLSQNARAQWSLMAAAIFIFLAWQSSVSGAAPIVWIVLALAFAAWRLRFTDRVLRAAGAGQAPFRVALMLGCGGVLMALPVAGFAQMTDLTQAMVSIILLALATGSVISTSGYRKVFMAYAAPMLLPLAAAWALAPAERGEVLTHLGLAGLVLLFLGFLVSVARQQAKVFEDSCRIRFAEKRLNAQLRKALDSESEAHRAKTQFLAAASHDLRQPIHSMNVLVAALSMRPLDERGAEIARLLARVNQTLSSQLDALLDISRLDAGTVQPVRSLQQLDRLAGEQLQLLESAAQERGVRCVLEASEPVTVWTDPGLLLRIVSNLTDNALKYNRPAGEVRLKVWQDEDHACLSVSDTGIGIAQVEQAKVFQEFYQVDNVERDRTKGLGLGLSIVQRLAALLDIEVRMRSTPGEGTEITLRMPLAPQDAGIETSASTTPETGPQLALLQGLRVLVVDDDSQVRQSMDMLLTEVGCRVFLASGSAAAQEIARHQTLDVLLTDMRLQAGDDGLQVLQAVRALQPQLRAALVTGDTAPERLRQAQGAGVPLLHKPVSLAMLQRVLAPGGHDA